MAYGHLLPVCELFWKIFPVLEDVKLTEVFRRKLSCPYSNRSISGNSSNPIELIDVIACDVDSNALIVTTLPLAERFFGI